MDIRAVIFDLGGVLLRTEKRTPRALLARRFGMSFEEIDTLVFNSHSSKRATIGDINAREHWLAVCKHLGVDHLEVDQIRHDFFAGDQLDNRLIDYIRGLKKKYKIGLLSNAWDDLRVYLTDIWKISEIFDSLIISAEVSMAKPDPRIYYLAVESLAVVPGEAVFIDDFLENVLAARKIGLHAIHFYNPEALIADLNQYLLE